jgi:hypothetical protein
MNAIASTLSRPGATQVLPSTSAKPTDSGPSLCSNFGVGQSVMESISPELGYASYVER